MRPAVPLVALLACLTLSGCLPMVGGGDAQTSRPQTGQCHDTPDSVLPEASDPTPAVACGEPHTLETYAVLDVDGPLDREALADVDQRCTAEVADFLGGDDFLPTTVSVYYFTPTKAQRADGARWVRCDAGVVRDTGVLHARRVTGSLQGAFADGVPKAYRRCIDAVPDPSSSQPLVPCTQPHRAEQIPQGVDLGDPRTPYPGTQDLAGEANARCSSLATSEVPDSARSLVVVPTRAMWRSGDTTAQCWALAAPGGRLNDSEAQPA